MDVVLPRGLVAEGVEVVFVEEGVVVVEVVRVWLEGAWCFARSVRIDFCGIDRV